MVPRDYGSFACPGRCPVLPYRMGQGATLDEETQQREAVGWEYSGHGSNVQTPKLEFGGSPDGLPERAARASS